MELLLSQKNALFKRLAGHGMDMSAWKLTYDLETGKWYVSYAIDVPEPMVGWHFRFEDWDDRGWFVARRPGLGSYSESDEGRSWESLLDFAAGWARAVQSELGEGADLWEEVAKLPRLSAPLAAEGRPVEDDRTPFTPTEVKQIHASLDQLAQRLEETHELATEERAVMLGVIEQAREAATDKTPRGLWRGAFLGWFVSHVMTKAVSTQAMAVVWAHVVAAFGAAASKYLLGP